MTPVTTQPGARGEGLFIADFCPRLGAYLSQQHSRGYDAVAARARFVLWLGVHADGASRLIAEEETELAARIAAGRRAEDSLAAGGAQPAETRAHLERVAEDGGLAGDRLAGASLWLVISLAQRFAGRGVPFPELVEAGNVGLARAAEKYDPAKGYRFTTYATWWIRQAITRAVAGRLGLPCVPAQAPGAGGTDELVAAERRLLEAVGREPTPEELAAELDLPLGSQLA